MNDDLKNRVEKNYLTLFRKLSESRDVFWTGRLSASALSTATAISALSVYLLHSQELKTPLDKSTEEKIRSVLNRGVRWLLLNRNDDGGWGDTIRSRSNSSTTILVKAAFRLYQKTLLNASVSDVSLRNERIENNGSSLVSGCSAPPSERTAEANDFDFPSIDAYLESQDGIPGIRKRYGKDKTFVVPILTNAALAEFVDWKEVPPLPFELAALPHSFFRFIRLPVVSYAIPALVAIGQTRLFHAPPKNPLVRIIRNASINKTLKKLESMRPESGGYLEATPLTAFVLMSLASCGQTNCSVVASSVRFLLNSCEEDGSFPIDTNLATWVTTLSINAIRSKFLSSNYVSPKIQTNRPERSKLTDALSAIEAEETAILSDPRLLDWLTSCQHKELHPFTAAAPGGWAWTNLSGGVPDADDTPGALLALAKIYPYANSPNRRKIASAAVEGLRWLLNIQNKNGGFPTFCRGWGTLPFDRSSVDITAHAIRAYADWIPFVQNRVEKNPADSDDFFPCDAKLLSRKLECSLTNAFSYLCATRTPDGSWTPLWFGNQNNPDDVNPCYGTGKVLKALAALLDLARNSLDERRTRPFFGKKFFRNNNAKILQLAVAGAFWAISSQNPDGGWGNRSNAEFLNPEISAYSSVGSRSSLEETAVVLDALFALLKIFKSLDGREELKSFQLKTKLPNEDRFANREFSLASLESVCERGVLRLCEMIERKEFTEPSPIGFYFAKLWYFEEAYPTVFAVSALNSALNSDLKSNENNDRETS